jgi:hypothetical protein
LEDIAGQPLQKKQNHLTSMKLIAFEARLGSIFQRLVLHLSHFLLVSCFFEFIFPISMFVLLKKKLSNGSFTIFQKKLNFSSKKEKRDFQLVVI